ncbi:MAG TPA: hypothetical protein VHC20_01410 [Candidatus Paceibacterota bacterium]|nr:hypothetical protein [Candidatus Paceibacterota bacterium]
MSAHDADDIERGVLWWNSLPEFSRVAWLDRANSSRPLHVWHFDRSQRLGP